MTAVLQTVDLTHLPFAPLEEGRRIQLLHQLTPTSRGSSPISTVNCGLPLFYLKELAENSGCDPHPFNRTNILAGCACPGRFVLRIKTKNPGELTPGFLNCACNNEKVSDT